MARGVKPGTRHAGHWKPGQSGNPTGRAGRHKDITAIRKLARKHTEAAISALIHVCNNGKSDASRVAAACALLDRGYGRPEQAITDGQGGPARIVVEVVQFAES